MILTTFGCSEVLQNLGHPAASPRLLLDVRCHSLKDRNAGTQKEKRTVFNTQCCAPALGTRSEMVDLDLVNRDVHLQYRETTD